MHGGICRCDMGAVSICVGVDGHRAITQLPRRADDAQGNLAAICNEHTVKWTNLFGHGHRRIRGWEGGALLRRCLGRGESARHQRSLANELSAFP
ncbi:hypothetical protein SDC9_77561 [bioreactor metagenome]|uniref:Uncharacterized protein n=1 Tax=bioreactor metagenome TaxID=1076179 RepID=A0A644YSR7_9ZZZZ